MQSHSGDTISSQEPDVTLDQIPHSVESARQAFAAGVTHSVDWRMDQLDGLLRFLKEQQGPILEALSEDLGKPHFDALMSEIVSLEMDILYVKKRLRKWMKPVAVGTALINQPGRSVIYREPLGVVLIISAWNYPLQLSLGPLIGALAAGNAVVLKPSEVAPSISALLARSLPEYLDGRCIKVIEGAVRETTKLLEERFDHIFYTGNGTVGRIVMRAASEHLTPVTLELGGKSPCLVDETADLTITARRLVWGKFFNCGQTCVAPDYVLVQESVLDALVEEMVAQVKRFWGDKPKPGVDYARIVNARHYQRLMKLLDGAGDIVCGGYGEEQEGFLAPTLVTNVPEDSPLMRDEIFGPILPIIAVADLDAAIRFVRSRPKPLALYLFSRSEENQQRLLEETSSGGAMINHCLLHNMSSDLPFGGVGESGMGCYHGRSGFETFSHRKSVLKKPIFPDLVLLYPQYSRRIAPLAERLVACWRALRGT